MCVFTSLCLSWDMTFDQLCVECLFKGGGGDMKNIPLLSEEKKKAYPTNVVDLWVVACKPVILAGNQSCSQSYELVKCVTCQGSLGGFSSRGLWIKATSLEQGPLLLWQRRSQILKDFHLSPDSLYSHPFFFFFYSQRKWDESGTRDLGNHTFPC